VLQKLQKPMHKYRIWNLKCMVYNLC
jgi:hypothetical protein